VFHPRTGSWLREAVSAVSPQTKLEEPFICQAEQPLRFVVSEREESESMREIMGESVAHYFSTVQAKSGPS
jgi:hypothetical protein